MEGKGKEIYTMVKEFCQQIMKGVVDTGIVTQENAEKACDIMKEEAKAFFTGEKYENQRQCIQDGTLHDGYIIADIVTECVSRLSE